MVASGQKERTMGYKAKISDMRGELRVMNRLIPETAAGFATLSKAVKENGPLSLKEKEYVALGIAISQRCEPASIPMSRPCRRRGRRGRSWAMCWACASRWGAVRR